MKKEFEIQAISDYQAVIAELLGACSSNIFLLIGDLGAGKTTLVKAIGDYLQVEDSMSSPTFSIVNVYLTASGKKIYHLDLYRIDSAEEAFDFGIMEILESGQYVFIEWPEVIEPLLQGDECIIELVAKSDSSRLLKIVTA